MSTDSQTLTHLSDGDQRNAPNSEIPEADRHEQAVEKDTHQNLDVKDQKSFANKLDQAKAEEKAEKAAEKEPEPMPTEAARSHGNEPSRGAKIDEQIRLEEEAELRKKGKLD